MLDFAVFCQLVDARRKINVGHDLELSAGDF